LVELRLSAGKTLYSFRQFEIAALPQHSAESLWLSGPSESLERGCASAGGAASQNIMKRYGKAEPFRTVLRQSRRKDFNACPLLQGHE
jgi:hypothetical protein